MIKTILSGAIVLFSLSSSIFADDHVMMVEWDGTPGYLESTIMADTPVAVVSAIMGDSKYPGVPSHSTIIT